VRGHDHASITPSSKWEHVLYAVVLTIGGALAHSMIAVAFGVSCLALAVLAHPLIQQRAPTRLRARLLLIVCGCGLALSLLAVDDKEVVHRG
jgi:hypothetical protein